jgi:hypothetical protein
VSVQVRRYQPEDLLLVKLRKEATVAEELLVKAASGHAKYAINFTAVADNGEIIACFGIDDLWEGVGQLWAVFTDGAFGYPRLYRKLRYLMAKVWEDFKYRRWQASVSVNDRGAIRLVEHLGLSKEAVMAGYGPEGEDHMLYAKVR